MYIEERGTENSAVHVAGNTARGARETLCRRRKRTDCSDFHVTTFQSSFETTGLRQIRFNSRRLWNLWTVHLTCHFFSCSEHALIVAHHTAWLKCWCMLRLIRIVIHVCDFIVCSLHFPHFVPIRVFLLSLLLLPEPGPVPLPLPCGLHRGNIPLALRQMRSLALWPITRLSQVMNATSLTISTTQRQLKSSSRSNPATRCPRICSTRNSTMRPSAERSLHHCSPRSEKIQRAVDKLITLMTKVCRPVSRRRLSVIEWRDPL